MNLESAEYYILRADVAPKGGDDPRDGTAFALDAACPACGTGARQLSPLRLRAFDLPKKSLIAQTYRGRQMLHTTVVEAVSSRFSVIKDFLQVEHRSTFAPLPFHQLVPRFTMPKLDPATQGLMTERQCQVCLRDGHFDGSDGPIEYVYRLTTKQRTSLAIVAQTWECFGLSVREAVEAPPDKPWLARVAGFAVPHIIARADFCEALVGLIGVKRLSFDPVRFIID